MIRRLVLLTLLLLGAVALAQGQSLVVNGITVEGVTSSLVPGHAYAPAQAYAEALGADYSFDVDRQIATFELASRVVTLDIFTDASAAASASRALSQNGRSLPSMGGVLVQGGLFVPVKTVAGALGGSVAYLARTNTVMVVLPRATLQRVRSPDRRPGYERFVLTFSALAPISSQDDVAQNRVTFRFGRTDYGEVQSFQGDYFQDARLVPTEGRVEFSLSLEPGSRYQHYTTPNPDGGFSFVVDVFPANERTPETPVAARPRIVLDPGHGGADSGLDFPLGSESELALDFVERLASLLEAQGFAVQLTRDGDSAIAMEQRSSLGAGANLYLSIHGAPLAVDQLKLYYLGEATGIESLSMAIRENAETAVNSSATDALRRRILLDMVANLDLGEIYAQRLAGGLEGMAGYSVETAPAPIYVLGGAAGRGLLLELGPQSFTSERLPETLAELIGDLLGSSGR